MYKLVTLEEICSFITDGKHGDCEDQIDSEYYFLSAKDIKEESIFYEEGRKITESDFLDTNKRTRFEVDDILITNTGASVGRFAIAKKDDRISKTTFQKSVSLLKANPIKVLPLYLYYHLISKKAEIINLGGGSAQANLLLRDIRAFKINIPPLATQQKIASILSAYDELIENNKQRIKLLESMAEEIYKEWFVRLRFPNYENTTFIDGLPIGWEETKLENQIKIFRGKSYTSEELRESDGLPMLNLKNINRGGGFRRDGLKYFEGKFTENNLAFAGDIILAVTDMTQNRELVGRVARVPQMNISQFVFSMDLIKITPIFFPKNFVYSFFRFSGIGLKLAEFANGANVLHLTPNLINYEKAKFPTLELAIKFDEIITPIFDEIDILENKNQLLQQTRDLLLPRLISGKLRVEEKLYKIEQPEMNVSMAAELAGDYQ